MRHRVLQAEVPQQILDDRNLVPPLRVIFEGFLQMRLFGVEGRRQRIRLRQRSAVPRLTIQGIIIQVEDPRLPNSGDSRCGRAESPSSGGLSSCLRCHRSKLHKCSQVLMEVLMEVLWCAEGVTLSRFQCCLCEAQQKEIRCSCYGIRSISSLRSNGPL